MAGLRWQSLWQEDRLAKYWLQVSVSHVWFWYLPSVRFADPVIHINKGTNNGIRG